MTGREINNLLVKNHFFLNAVDFYIQKYLEFENHEEAKEFLTLYCVFLTTQEYTEYSEEKLLEVYETISKKLTKNSKISSKEFLVNPAENNKYIVRENRCQILSINNYPPV